MAAGGRRRVGVVVLIDPPAGEWIDGLRRAVGDVAVERIRPHVTLVPPLNLKAADLDTALALLRHAAGRVPGPLRLTAGPAATFLPANPVLYLEVGGDLPALEALRDAVFRPPLVRSLSWPWVPHVTIADDVAPDRIDALTSALDLFTLPAPVERVTLLEEHHTPDGRRWVPCADAALGPPAVVGRGGLALTMTVGRTPDPWGEALLGDPPLPVVDVRRRVVVTAQREGALAGAAMAWLDDDGGHVRVVTAPEVRRSGVGGHVLAAVEEAVRDEGWRCGVLVAQGPPEFYRARSSWSRPPGD